MKWLCVGKLNSSYYFGVTPLGSNKEEAARTTDVS